MSTKISGLLPSSDHKKKYGAATVAGDQVESEIYTRADGKKVRRIKRVVKKSESSEGINVEAKVPDENTNGGLNNFLGSSLDDVKKSPSATVSGEHPARTTTASPAEEGEIYIRPDGKKVRRIKKPKAVTGASSVSSAGAVEKKSLTNFLDLSSAGTVSKKSGSATVSGDRVSSISAAKPDEEGEIVIRADGKKVRRIRKVITRSKSGNSQDLQSMISGDEPPTPNTVLAPATVTPGNTETEVYINAEGKKVRRVRKSAVESTVTDTSASLGSLIDNHSAAGSAGAITVAGDRPTKSTSEGEVYIRADGKKVRKVKKPKATDASSAEGSAVETTADLTTTGGSETETLNGFMASSKPSVLKSGAATVSGGQIKEESEIYIRPDGKKVRRIKKSIVRAKPDSVDNSAVSTAPNIPVKAVEAESVDSEKNLASFLGAESPRSKKSGSATVTGIPASQNALLEQSEIYINAQGKKVRRIKKSVLAQSSVAPTSNALSSQAVSPLIASPSPTPPARAASPLTTSFRAPSPVTPKAAASDRAGDLAKMFERSPVKSKQGSATVAGDLVSKQHKEGEIYIRPDGKKVRRIKKSAVAPLTANNSSLGGFLGADSFVDKKSGSATVAGDQVVVKKTEDGEIIIRADGKKVLRRRKAPAEGKAEEEGEVYRRADGKLVRRVKRNSAADSLDSSVHINEPSGKNDSGAVTTAEKGRSSLSSLSDLLKRKPSDIGKDRPTTPQTAPMSEASAKDDANDFEARVGPVTSKSIGPASPTVEDSKRTFRGWSPFRRQKSSATLEQPKSESTDMPTTPNLQLSTAVDQIESSVQSNSSPAPVEASQLRASEPDLPNSSSLTNPVSNLPESVIPLSLKQNLQSIPSSTLQKSDLSKSQHKERVDPTVQDKVTSSENAVKPSLDSTLAFAAPPLAHVLPLKAVTKMPSRERIVAAPDAEPATSLLSSSDEGTSTVAAINKVQSSPRQDDSDLASNLDVSSVHAASSSKLTPISTTTPQPELEADSRHSYLIDVDENSRLVDNFVAPPSNDININKMTSSDRASPFYTESQGLSEEVKAPLLSSNGLHNDQSLNSDQLHADTNHLVEDNVINVTMPRQTTKIILPEDSFSSKIEREGVEDKAMSINFADTIPSPPLLDPQLSVSSERYEKDKTSASSSQNTSDEVVATDAICANLELEKPKQEVTEESNLVSDSADKVSNSSLEVQVEIHDGPFAVPTMPLSDVSENAVCNKLEQKGVEENTTSALEGDAASLVSRPIITSTFTPPSSLATAPDLVSSSVSSYQCIKDGETVANDFQPMAKMVLTGDVDCQNTITEGSDRHVIAPVDVPSSPVCSSNLALAVNLSAEDESTVERFRKMTKMGLPEDAVRHKMFAEGLDESLINAVFTVADAPPLSNLLTSASSQKFAEDEATAERINKTTEMGLSEAANHQNITYKPTADKITNDAFSHAASSSLVSAPAPASKIVSASDSLMSEVCLPALSDEEQNVVASYKKMVKMGMPKSAVEHKMTQDCADPKLIPYVMAEDMSTHMMPVAPLLSTTLSQPQAIGGDNAVAYIVVVPDEPQSVAVDGTLRSEIPADAIVTDPNKLKIHPDEKFAVKVDDKEGESVATHGETKYMTLDQIAQLSGQSVTELEAMVTDKRCKAQNIPRFVLQPLEKRASATLFEVEIPKSEGLPAKPSVPAPPVPEGSNMTAVKEGEEVVDAKLANAVRAVAALGDGDMESLLAKLKAGEMGELIEKLREAEKRQKKLEKQLAQAGVKIAEDIDYSEAKDKVQEIAKRMNEIGGSDVTIEDKELQNRLREEYFKLEQEMERYNNALMLTEEYQSEQDAAERRWEEENRSDNLEALKKLRRHMPVSIRNMSEADLTNNPTPNGKFLPKPTAKKFKRTNVLQLLRINPDDIERMHPASLEGMRVTGLTLTERRALYCHLEPVGPKWEKNKSEKMTERKWTWYQMMKNNFKENLAPFKRHCDQYGPPGNHPYATKDNPNGCPLIGKQCPIKADLVTDYNGDYGFTDADEYEVSDVKKSDVDDPGAKAMAEALELARSKKANERADILKKHYKGKLLQVSKANGSCEAMDEAMDKMENYLLKWIEFMIGKGGPGESEDDKKKEVANFGDALTELKLMVLDFAQRSGMQMSGKKKAGGDTPDPRSIIEAGLSEEVYECWLEFSRWINDRMKTIDVKDTKVEKTIELLAGMLTELHGRNCSILEDPSSKRPTRSRKLKKSADMRKEVEEAMKPKEDPVAAEESSGGRPMGLPPGADAGGRGGMLAALQGRGRGDGGRGGLLDAIGGRGRGGGGRGGLMDAIAGRGKGGGGRGGLMDAIAGRGKKGPGGGGDAGRGGLMDAIAGRGKKGPGGGGEAGRGGLMAAIAARGGGGGDAGRGGLMAAIAARGGG